MSTERFHQLSAHLAEIQVGKERIALTAQQHH